VNALATATRAPATVDHVFYDGECGFCHWSVRFLAERDRDGCFRYAPLGGPTFLTLVPEERRDALPDSLVIHTAGGGVLVESPALLHCLRRLGGGFALLGRLLGLLPRAFRDAAYAAFAKRRRRLFGRPDDACPIPSGALRARLDP
jgi:predicted DCC family thiol-disulfide oxidoreductase YuxK